MQEKEPFFEDKVRKSFEKVKEDIFELKEALKLIRNELKDLKEQKNKELDQIEEDLTDLSQNKPILTDKKNISSGNRGVYANMQAFSQAHMQTDTKQINTKAFKSGLDHTFINLPKREFLAFLTVYQFEEEGQTPTYLSLSQKMGVSEGCIRTHISNLLKKGIPLIKNKVNNKLIILSIEPSFKELNLKQKLADFYYNKDPLQTRLSLN